MADMQTQSPTHTPQHTHSAHRPIDLTTTKIKKPEKNTKPTEHSDESAHSRDTPSTTTIRTPVADIAIVDSPDIETQPSLQEKSVQSASQPTVDPPPASDTDARCMAGPPGQDTQHVSDVPHGVHELTTVPIEAQAQQIYDAVNARRSTFEEPTIWGTVINANGIGNMYKGDSLAKHVLRGDWDVIHITETHVSRDQRERAVDDIETYLFDKVTAQRYPQAERGKHRYVAHFNTYDEGGGGVRRAGTAFIHKAMHKYAIYMGLTPQGIPTNHELFKQREGRYIIAQSLDPTRRDDEVVVYAPNTGLDSSQFPHTKEVLSRLQALQTHYSEHLPQRQLSIMGDFNIIRHPTHVRMGSIQGEQATREVYKLVGGQLIPSIRQCEMSLLRNTIMPAHSTRVLETTQGATNLQHTAIMNTGWIPGVPKKKVISLVLDGIIATGPSCPTTDRACGYIYTSNTTPAGSNQARAKIEHLHTDRGWISYGKVLRRQTNRDSLHLVFELVLPRLARQAVYELSGFHGQDTWEIRKDIWKGTVMSLTHVMRNLQISPGRAKSVPIGTWAHILHEYTSQIHIVEAADMHETHQNAARQSTEILCAMAPVFRN